MTREFRVVGRHRNQLAILCDLYGSDKGTATLNSKFISGWDYHDYTDYYEMLFRPLRSSVKHLLEVGIGTNNPKLRSSMGVRGKPGASLRVWRDYFPNAEIVGVDIDTEILFSEDRIKTFFCDQTNANEIEKFFDSCSIKSFDIIIDDGLHSYDAAKIFFENSWPKLKHGGIYIIEDTHWWTGGEIDFLEMKNLPYFGYGNFSPTTTHNRLVMITK